MSANTLGFRIEGVSEEAVACTITCVNREYDHSADRFRLRRPPHPRRCAVRASECSPHPTATLRRGRPPVPERPGRGRVPPPRTVVQGPGQARGSRELLLCRLRLGPPATVKPGATQRLSSSAFPISGWRPDKPAKSQKEITMFQNPPTPGSAGVVDRRQLEKSVSWTRRERLRLLWYRFRLTVVEMNYATRRMVELQAFGGSRC
jgi:hypothetical protein